MSQHVVPSATLSCFCHAVMQRGPRGRGGNWKSLFTGYISESLKEKGSTALTSVCACVWTALLTCDSNVRVTNERFFIYRAPSIASSFLPVISDYQPLYPASAHFRPLVSLGMESWSLCDWLLSLHVRQLLNVCVCMHARVCVFHPFVSLSTLDGQTTHYTSIYLLGSSHLESTVNKAAVRPWSSGSAQSHLLCECPGW